MLPRYDAPCLALLARQATARRWTRPLVATALGLALVAAAAPGAASSPAEPADIAAAEQSESVATTPALPFDMPSAGELRSSPRKVFAHWVPSLPVSLDNQPPTTDYYARHYLNPNGENGKHAAYGGFLRDRPLPRAPRPESNWRLLDMESEVRQAIAAGLDGFSVVIYELPETTSPQWTNINLMMQAATNVDPGFKIMIMPDMSSGSSLSRKDIGTVARGMAHLAYYPSAYRVSDGRVVVSPFTAEGHSVDWWREFLRVMRDEHGVPVAFLPLFQDERPHADAFAPISYGMSIWGNRNPAGNDPTTTHPTSPRGRIARIHSIGQKWMQPVSTQDERPRAGIFDEAQNTTNLRNTWEIATDNGAELVQLATWSDYPEGSHMAPSANHGWSYLDISSYYLAKYKTGRTPTIVRDTVYLTHRLHALSARPSYPQTRLMSLRGGSSPARDTVEALTFLTAPATVTVRVGNQTHQCQAPAGVGTCTVPLSPGTVAAQIQRGGATVSSVTSPHTVTSSPYVQNFEYAAASSGREGTSTPGAPPPPPPPPPGPTPSIAVNPTADTYANEGAPGDNYGWSGSLNSRGNVGSVSYLRFPIPEAPAGRTLVRASLKIRVSDESFAGSAEPHQVRLASNSWSESGVTWNSRPPLISGPIGALPGNSSPNATYGAPLDVEAVRELQGKEHTLALTNTGTDSLWAWSSNHPDASYRPQLLLTYQSNFVPALAPS